MLHCKKRIVAACLMIVFAVAGSAHAAEGWNTSLKQAITASKKTGKPILLNFTGSDWCEWCFKLKEEVFSKPTFKKWAHENVVLLEADFPRQSPQPTALKRQNEALAMHYNIRGFPTILFIDAEGNVLGRSGYMQGGADAWTSHAQQIVNNMPGPPALETADSLGDAISEAKENKLPLLLILLDDNKGIERMFEKLAEDEQFIKMANQRTVARVIKRTGGDAAPNNELEALDQLTAKLDLPRRPGQIAVLDVSGDEPKQIAHFPTVAGGSRLVSQIETVLPKIRYDGRWIDDYGKAQAIASQSDRPMLLNFTGSDWCGWCIKLKAEVFSKPQFKQFAEKNLVLVELDFPSKKKLDPETKAQNERLKNKFGIRGFPTIILVDAAGNEIARTGYQPGGADNYIKHLQQLTGE